jgi:RNA polymerase sigma factor (TIGR02999 family)
VPPEQQDNYPPSSVPSLICAAERGDKAAAEALFCAMYAELRRLAKRELARHGGGVTLSATTLLHQAYLDIAGKDTASFPDRARFMGYAARVMRGLIIDYARNRQAQKRGGLFELTSLGPSTQDTVDDHKLVHVSEALDELAKAEPALAEIVDLKFFCGFTFSEIGAMQGVSERTIQRQWERARIYLHRAMRADLENPCPL